MIRKVIYDTIRLVIYDQLNPAYAKYYTQSEIIELLKDSVFTDIQTYHRHNYSWSAISRKPSALRI